MKTTHIFATVVAILIVSMSGHTYAESRKTDASVSGHVIDAKTGEHLPYVTVMIGGTQIGIQTSSSGHYSIRNLPLGKHEIIATSIGYKDASVTLEFKAGQSYEANFSLERENLSLDGVVVSATRNHSSRKEAPALVNVIDSRIFATTSSPTLAEGLTFQPGVRVENTVRTVDSRRPESMAWTATIHKSSSIPDQCSRRLRACMVWSRSHPR